MEILVEASYDPEEKVWSGPIVKDPYGSEMTLGTAIVNQLQKTPQKVIQIMDSNGSEMTAQEFLDNSKALARNILRELEMKCHDVIGLYVQHSEHVATVMMASFLCGTPVSSAFYGFGKDTVVPIFKTTRPKLIFCDAENYKEALAVSNHLELHAKIVIMTGKVEGVTTINDLLESKEEAWAISQFPCSKLNGSETALILCSSGTTGTPKAVTCSHQALLNKIIFVTASSDSTMLCFSTMYWASGVGTLISSLLHSSVRIVPSKPFSPEYFVHVVKQYKVTHIFCSVAQAAETVFNYSKEELREAFKFIDEMLVAGSKVPQVVQEILWDILGGDHTTKPGLSVGYGMTETTGGISISGGYPYEYNPLSEGKLLPNKKMCIVDENNEKLGPNESGEILLYSPYAWNGYYNDPEATAKAMHGQWLRSGDIGFVDNLGFVHVQGRSKEMFKWKGYQICPAPIEDVLLKLPGVAEVCVFPKADLVAESLVACAIVRAKTEDGLNLTDDMVHKYVDEHLESLYQMRGGVHFIDSMPRTASDKIIRKQVVEMFVNHNEMCKVSK
ncbi:uncharacterized protein LOC142238709 [Haematobia irritans]|uniref:uncharacterized protein LOC142238709 n=1 Tax=Haematobia irritans TaxID=7368 RepID=UPI003F4FBE47